MNSQEKDDLLKIDLARLEDCCSNQHIMLRQWGDKLALARKKVTDLENAAKVCKAELGKKIRQRYEAYGLVKGTEAEIESAILTQPEYKAAVELVTQAEYEKDLIKSMVDALHDRRTELENLVQLHGQMYFAKPNTSGQPKKARTDPTKPTGKVNRP